MKNLFKNPVYIAAILGVSFIILDLMVYVLANFPGESNYACTPGAYFTPGNLIYSALFSLMVGIFIVGFYELAKMKSKPDASLLSFSGIGMLLAGLTTFCTACTIPVISLFGFSIGLSIFTDFNTYFKIAALLIMASSLFLLNRQLNKNCNC
jgi:hypothetical protein